MIEASFKSLNRLNPEIIWDMFECKPAHYNLRRDSTAKTKSRKFGVNSLMFRGSLT